MKPLAHNSTDAELLLYIDQWVRLLDAEDYESAFALTEHHPEMGQTPRLIREIIKSYGESNPEQKATLTGKPTDITQRKEVTRFDISPRGEAGEIWYDLNIDGITSDLTATFTIRATPGGLIIQLDDIQVM